MDPQACLDDARAAIAAGDLEAARARLHEYVEWRSRCGFEPPGGDCSANYMLRLVHRSERDRSA